MADPTDDVKAAPPDDAAQGGGTPAAESERNAEADANREKLLQTLQEKAARVNAAEAERDRLKAQLDALTRTQSPAAGGGDPRAERLQAVRDYATGRIGDVPDPVAAEVLELREQLAMTVQELANVRELDRVGDDTKRKKIAEHFNQNRHRLGDVRAARAEIEAEERAQRVAEQDAEIERLRKSLADQSRRPGPDVVRTHLTEMTFAELKDVESRADWKARQEELRIRSEAGDIAAQRQRERDQVRVAAGKVRLKD